MVLIFLDFHIRNNPALENRRPEAKNKTRVRPETRNKARKLIKTTSAVFNREVDRIREDTSLKKNTSFGENGEQRQGILNKITLANNFQTTQRAENISNETIRNKEISQTGTNRRNRRHNRVTNFSSSDSSQAVLDDYSFDTGSEEDLLDRLEGRPHLKGNVRAQLFKEMVLQMRRTSKEPQRFANRMVNELQNMKTSTPSIIRQALKNLPLRRQTESLTRSTTTQNVYDI